MKYIILYQLAFSDIVMVGENVKTRTIFFNEEEVKKKLEYLITQDLVIHLTKKAKSTQEGTNYWVIYNSDRERRVICCFKHKDSLLQLQSNCMLLEEIHFSYNENRIELST